MLLFYIFVKKEGSNPFSSNGRVKIFSSESRKFFVRKQPHPIPPPPLPPPQLFCPFLFLTQFLSVLVYDIGEG